MPTAIPAEPAPQTADAVVHGKYHFLDVGAQMYGDCIVAEFGTVRVLIDGSHEKDFEGQPGFESTPEQLERIFGAPAPHDITLMVVTHCHQDHIGALPQLVSEGIIRPKFALVIDPKLGFGRSADDSDPSNQVDFANERTQRLAAALREEDASELDDAQLAEFIDGAATVESKYLAMIGELTHMGVRVIKYHGQKLPAALATAMKSTGMTLLGPSTDQIVFAANQIAKTNSDAADAVMSALDADAGASDVDLYRGIVGREAADAAGAAGVSAIDAGASNPRGNGMNCQSITLAFGAPGERVLLAGDMQFAEPGVKGADAEVARLRETVKQHGPYRLYKTTHHTSHNGQNDAIFDDFGKPPLIVHSGGRKDASHPFPATLKLLKRRARDLAFARTDRNGLITVEPHLAAEDAITVSRGRLNDFTDNVTDDSEAIASGAGRGAPAPTVFAAAARRSGTQIVIVNLPDEAVDITVGGLDIIVRKSRSAGAAPGTSGDPQRVAPPRPRPVRPPVSDPRSAVRLAGGRTLPRLLFVTDIARLADNIGREEAQRALDAVRNGRHAFIDIGANRSRPQELAQRALRSDPSINGVVILGGYDVVPSMNLDVLPADLRSRLGAANVSSDADQFRVWSDEPYSDLDGDNIAERPVSRIPDARSAPLFLTALQCGPVAPGERFGVRNIARPFAETIWGGIAGTRHLNVSRRFLHTNVQSAETGKGSQYFMLHGSDSDATTFSGEDGANYPRAFTVGTVPGKFDGIVFAGCCWGALTVRHKALDGRGATPEPRLAESSIALSYLKAGANAFVGCTGSHYSGPDTEPEKNYALPLHAAFWKTLPQVQYSAAVALHGARKYYGDLIVSGSTRREPLEIARRLKNRAQFTCLGLGW